MFTPHSKHRIFIGVPAKQPAQPFLHRSRQKGGRASEEGRLTRQGVLLLVINGLFAVATALSGTFVNVYLWKVSNELSVIGWFAVSSHVVNALTFFFAGKWVKEYNKMNCLRVGVALSALFYLAVLLLGHRSVDVVWLLGGLQGMASGLFWLSFNVIYFEVTDPDNRDRFNGWAGLLGALSGMIAPWCSGLMITRLAPNVGYRVVFALSLAIFVAGAVVSFFLRKRKVSGSYRWTYAYRHLLQSGSHWRKAMPALVAQGVREGVFVFLIGLLVYIATRNEMKLGNYFLITSAVSLISFWLAGRLMKFRHRSAAMLIGTLSLTLVILPFFIGIKYGTLLVFGIGTALFFPLYVIPMTSTVFDLIGRDEDSARHRVEFIVLRESGLNAGRLLGSLGFIGVLAATESETVFTWMLLVIGSFPLLSWWFMRPLLRGGARGSADGSI